MKMERYNFMNVLCLGMLLVICQKETIAARCKFVLQNLNGYIKSPGYPSNYPGNLDCTWLIHVPDRYTITLTTESFRLEGPSPDCEHDALMIYDGFNVSANAFKSPYCERNGPTTIQSSKNFLYIRFISDAYGMFSGFKMEYSAQANCNKTIKANNGTIASPRYPNDYYANANCHWHVTSDPGTFISLRFQDFKMEGTVGGVDQCYDHVSIYDVRETSKKLIKTFCGDKIPGKVESTKNEMILQLYTDATVNAKGFLAHFAAQALRTVAPTIPIPTMLHMCNAKQFRCKNGSCIDEDFRCNQIDDCHDASDEINCAASCAKNNGGCDQNCRVNSLWGPYCSCNHGYKLGKDKFTCEDIDECRKDNGNCSDKCTNFLGGFKCECSSEGYQIGADGTSCQDIDECLASSCSHHCVNTDGSYECRCHVGYRMSSSGDCYDINECAIGVPGCYDCVNTMGSYFCNCGAGFIGVENSTRCEDVDECQHSNGGCGHNCTNTFGSFRCHCLQGFQSFENGMKCKCPKEYTGSPDGKSCHKKVIKADCGLLWPEILPIDDGRSWSSSRTPWAWQAYISIILDYFEMVKWGCMATLVNKQFLLTTAHCVSIASYPVKPEHLKIWLGITDREQGKNSAYLVETISIHPEYKGSNSRYIGDLALIKLKNATVSNKHIKPICISQGKRISIGERAEVISWGRISETRSSKQLTQIRVEIKQPKDCSPFWSESNDSSRIYCAALISSEKKMCLLDSGSPLMVKDATTKQWFLLGILVDGAGYSVEKPCSNKNRTNFYHDLGTFYKWITENTSENS